MKLVSRIFCLAVFPYLTLGGVGDVFSHDAWMHMTASREVFLPRFGSAETDPTSSATADTLSLENKSSNERREVNAGILRMPGEFEQQQFLVMGCGELTPDYADKLAEIACETWGTVTVVILVADRQRRDLVEQALRRRAVPAKAVQFWEMPHDTKWVRDYGPIAVSDNRGRIFVDAAYDVARPNDDQIPLLMAGFSRTPVVVTSLAVEGGNLLSNGEGLCVTTSALVNRNAIFNLNEDAVRSHLSSLFGATQTVILEPLAGEPTGHVDMFTTFTAPDTVVVGAYDPAEDAENAALLDRNAARLAEIVTAHGRLRVKRIVMGARRDNIWRTYTNCVYANGVLLLPSYEDDPPGRARKAITTYEGLLPGWRVVPIDVTGLIRESGALHCVALNVPRFKQQAANRANVGLGQPAASKGKLVISNVNLCYKNL